MLVLIVRASQINGWGGAVAHKQKSLQGFTGSKMQVSIEAVSGIERRLKVSLSAETVEKEVEEEVEKRLKKAIKTVRINGFRKGKVPLKVVRQRFGLGVRQEVLNEVISSSFAKAVQQEQLTPVSVPDIESKTFAPGENLEYVATFDVYPEVKLADLSEIQVQRPVVDIADNDVESMIQLLRKQQADWKKTDEKAQQGDRVTIDFVGRKADGTEFDGGTAKDQQLELGSGSTIPGFEEGIVGMVSGGQRDVEVTFPDDYQAEDLRGEQVVFSISLSKCEHPELPVLDEAFFKTYGVTDGGEEQFRKEVLSNMQRELKNTILNKVKAQVMDQLVEKHEIEIPAVLIEAEISKLREQALKRLGGQIKEADASKMLPDKLFEEESRQRVVLGLVVSELVQQNQIKVEEDRVKAKIEEFASTYQSPQEVIEYYSENKDLLESVRAYVLEGQVVEFVLDAAQVSEVESSYEEVIKSQV